MNHHNPNGMSTPTLQSPASTFTQEQVKKSQQVFIYSLI